MPELPDVAMMRRYLQSTALHQEADDVEVRDAYVLTGVTPRELAHTLEGRRFESTRRHGKNLLVELDEGPWLRLHFGMTGHLRYFKDVSKDHEHTRILFTFANGYRLAYICQRKLGRVSLPPDPETFVGEHDLGPDALRIGREEFRDLLGGRRGGLKSTLMNQHIIAGLGNVYSDEVLYQAHMHPLTTFDKLDGDGLRTLYRTMKKVLEGSIERGADGREMPRTWLIGHRGEGESCPRCGGKIVRRVINGRGAYLCSHCQPRR